MLTTFDPPCSREGSDVLVVLYCNGSPVHVHRTWLPMQVRYLYDVLYCYYLLVVYVIIRTSSTSGEYELLELARVVLLDVLYLILLQ
jgi:hypothetical protein